ncbi:hypothetical protein M436DRAFT_44184 [Aureobasidium namibiae CBS 147.97]|uniref:F-box domain-containing protein n=1 Tax=Aureobasidium namibiae CBS 147.97 TaxID=1043004 RepID=A0A074WN30_9PEZI|nr:uncharacterized protein M436DRAFT_44184 [Aureobasidium namibiae CBS 147.97]KEQ74543.1 hypothetical protein M436DRAFT_44184 [Aureobasidium namibiae CBS 147.97]
MPRLLGLPAELVQNVLQFLEPTCLADVALTCRFLRNHALSDALWQQHVNAQLPHLLTSAAPLPSFRDLYIAHHPYWFLCRHKIWFSDSEPNGKLLLARYDPRRGCIEAYAIVAEPGIRQFEHWEHDEDVSIHTFNPKVQLDLNSPVLKLESGNPRTQARDSEQHDDQHTQPLPSLSREIMMNCSSSPGLYTSFMLARDLPQVAMGPGTRVWPPMKIPALSRTRNASTRSFQALSHRPSTLDEVSQNTFRLRKWVEFSGRLRMGEEVSTYGTLPPSCYVPTKEKPWQGIWCGDYSGHGCEFLLVLQPEMGQEIPLPEGMNHMLEWLATGRFRRNSNGSESSDSSYASAQEDQEPESDTSSAYDLPTPASSSTIDGQDVYNGRIEAIKLTGDPNVPRGEYTFIAPDIGDGGLVRIADEAAFKGARVVRSAGHIAGVGFAHDEYMASQLILISPDCLAQHWIEFGHISYYRRVDIDSLLQI